MFIVLLCVESFGHFVFLKAGLLVFLPFLFRNFVFYAYKSLLLSVGFGRIPVATQLKTIIFRILTKARLLGFYHAVLADFFFFFGTIFFPQV